MKKSALIIGSFTKGEHVFTGKIKTLAIDATITLQPNDDKEKGEPVVQVELSLEEYDAE